MAEFFAGIWDSILVFFRSINWITDPLDILLVAFAIYSVIKLCGIPGRSSCSKASLFWAGVFCFLAAQFENYVFYP